MISSIVSSCVGTIKSADPLPTKSVNNSASIIDTFEGLALANPISHNKVELFFNPILKDIDKYSYVIIYDKQQTPIYVAANSLVPDYRGYVKYTVRNLDPSTSYVFSVQVRDISSTRESSNNLRVSAKTFSNQTANFNGISEVRNLSGSAGLTGIEIFWPEAEMLGGLASTPESYPGDPEQYYITVLNSNYRTPSDMNTESVGEPERKVISTTATGKRSIVVSGLNPDTKYYVQVRCVQKGVNIDSNSSNINYKREENTTYLEIKTFSADKASLQFQASKFYLSWPPNNAGLFALTGNWIAPIGNFDHYRLYYARRYSKVDSSLFSLKDYLRSTDADSLCSDVETASSANSPVYCQEASATQTSATITGLDPNTQYDVELEVCITASCKNDDERVSSLLLSKITNPNIANFDGIKNILPSNNLNELNTVKLVFNAPIYASGTISGFLVDYYETSASLPITLNDGSVTSSVTVDPFDYHTECPNTGDVCNLTIRGIDVLATNNFCFSVYPFSYSVTGDIVPAPYKANLKPFCPSGSSLLSPPTSIDFTGLKTIDCNKINNYGKATLTWDLPLVTSTGIYDKFEIYYAASPTSFSFPLAHTQFDSGNLVTFGRIEVTGSLTTVNVVNLDPTKSYTFGINSYYNSPNQVLRSPDNLKLMSCDFPSMP